MAPDPAKAFVVTGSNLCCTYSHPYLCHFSPPHPDLGIVSELFDLPFSWYLGRRSFSKIFARFNGTKSCSFSYLNSAAADAFPKVSEVDRLACVPQNKIRPWEPMEYAKI
jgi:hypothetical protein